jgi:hypothetical protein
MPRKHLETLALVARPMRTVSVQVRLTYTLLSHAICLLANERSVLLPSNLGCQRNVIFVVAGFSFTYNKLSDTICLLKEN